MPVAVLHSATPPPSLPPLPAVVLEALGQPLLVKDLKVGELSEGEVEALRRRATGM